MQAKPNSNSALRESVPQVVFQVLQALRMRVLSENPCLRFRNNVRAFVRIAFVSSDQFREFIERPVGDTFIPDIEELFKILLRIGDQKAARRGTIEHALVHRCRHLDAG